MSNVVTYRTENNELITVEVLAGFNIEKIGKNYVAYTINDNKVSENVNIYISEIDYDGETPKIVPIKEDEAEMVLMFYNSIYSNNKHLI